MRPMSVVQSKVLAEARSRLGIQFADGGMGTTGYDCCTLIYCSMRDAGVKMPAMPPGHVRANGENILGWMRARYAEMTHAEAIPCDVVVMNRHRIQHAALLVDRHTIIHCDPRIGCVTEERKSSVWFDHCTFFRVVI